MTNKREDNEIISKLRDTDYCDNKCEFSSSEESETIVTAPVFMLCKKCGKPIKERQDKIEYIHKSLFPQPLSEEEILDFLDSWGYRHGNMPKCNDDDFRKIAQAISTHFCKPRISVEALERIIEGFRNKLPLMLIGYEETKLLAIAIHKRMEL